MKNKIISILLVSIMLFSLASVQGTAAVSGKDSDYSESIEFLNAVGISDVKLSDMDKTITRREAVLMALGLYMKNYTVFEYKNEFSDISSEDTEAGKLALAVKNGLVAKSTDGRFIPDGSVSYIDAIKMVFNALNYGPYVKSSGGGDAKYHMLANKYDVNIKAVNSSAITVGEMAQLVALAADAPLMKVTTVEANGDIYYNQSDDVSVLTEYYNIYKLEGVVTQNDFSSLYEKAALSSTGIVIDGVSLKCSENTDTSALLARNITAYYNEAAKELVYYSFDDSDDVLTIQCEDIEKFESDTYYVTEGDKTRKYSTTKNPAVIYNGVAVTSEDYELFMNGSAYIPENGYVELIKDSSGKYHCIKITDYETYVVQSMDISGLKLVDKYDPTRKLDLEDTDRLFIKGTDGEQISFEYISSMNVISAAVSLNNKAAKLIVSGNAVEGILTTFNDDEIQLEGEVFQKSDYFKEVSGKAINLRRGDEFIVYLDARGLAAMCAPSPNNNWEYGYMIKAGVDGSLDKKMQLKLLTTDNGVQIMDVAKKVTIDGIRKTKAEDAYNAVKNYFDSPIRYRLNVNGEIKEIDNSMFTHAGEGANSLKENKHEADDMSTTTMKDFTYINTVNGISLRYPDEADLNKKVKTWYYKEGAICFTVPKDAATAQDKDYSAAPLTAFEKSKQYGNNTISSYWEDKDELIDTLLVRRTDSGSDVAKRAYIVDRITQAVTEEGIEVTKLYLWDSGNVKEFTAMDSSVMVGKSLKRGDVIRIKANERNEIELIEETFKDGYTGIQIGSWDADGNYVYTEKNPYASDNGTNSDMYMIYGKAKNLKNNIMEIAYGTEGKTEKLFVTGRVIVIEKVGDRCDIRLGSISDVTFDPNLELASNILIDERYLVIRNIIVYK